MERTAQDERKLTAALAMLLKRISAGWEYPDAHAFTATSMKVDGDALRDAYDEAQAAYAERHPL